ncbi:FAD binding domain-containing protein [Penicillium hetheringtonii]|nr:FAD binding domain-containing protein [Penicillium hetheringtonii]
MHLVHFKSRQFAEERSFGKYWHTFCSHGGVILDQNDDDIFTAHLPTHLLPEGPVDPTEVVYRIMAPAGERHEIKIDEIYAHSEWAPNFSIAKQYYTDKMRVILAGDSAHRMPPHGGYGMNSGVVDAVDLGWRLAAIVKGYGGELLLKSYNMERRPMQIRTLQRAHRHIMEHIKLAQMYPQDHNPIDEDTNEGQELRARIGKFLQESGPETEDRGIEIDLRYHSPTIYPDGTPELEWTPDQYRPSTRPGSRAPHVFLKDGETSIYDLFGREWTLIHFVDDDIESLNKESASDGLIAAAARLKIPVSRVIIKDEPHVRRIWERNMVLVRPDTHVAWRADNIWGLNIDEILQVISGQKEFSRFQPSRASADAEVSFEALVKGITDGVTGGATIAQDDIA